MYGQFLLDVLHDEGIRMIGMSEDVDIIQSYGSLYETLLCWVLVDPLQRHGFCRYTLKLSFPFAFYNLLLHRDNICPEQVPIILYFIVR